MMMEPLTTNPSEIANPVKLGSTALRAAYLIRTRRGESPLASAATT